MNDSVFSADAPPGTRAKSNSTDTVSAVLALGILVATMLVSWFYSDVGFISPEHGLGYALGITGSVMMVIMLLYPLRKRLKSFRNLGPVKVWFRAHMVLGVVGPTLVVVHTNFSLGSTNGRVAMFCMVVVAVSGLIGRYLYRQIHHGLYGQKATLNELRTQSQSIRRHEHSIGGLFPELGERLLAFETALEKPSRIPFGAAIRPLIVNLRSHRLRRSLDDYVGETLRKRSQESEAVAGQRKRLSKTARNYIRSRLGISRRIAMFGLYERLFSVWHVLHIPLFALLVVSALVHVYAVHAY